jgi:tetratricopeptide (TPR) repeat protein
MPDTLADLLQVADYLLLGGDALDALEMLARAQTTAPDSPEPPYRMAEILISLGGTDHLTAARDHLRQAIALGADEADAYFRLMQVHIDLNHIPAAQDAYTQAVQRDPANARLREWGIRLALLRNDLGAALVQAERELASAPENFHWQRWVADLRLQTGDAAGARAMFDALIAAHLPADLPAEDWFAAQWGAILVSRADACRRVGDLDAASASLDRAEALIPDDPGILVGRGLVAWQADDDERAYDLLRAGLAAAPPEVRARLWPELADYPRREALRDALDSIPNSDDTGATQP